MDGCVTMSHSQRGKYIQIPKKHLVCTGVKVLSKTIFSILHTSFLSIFSASETALQELCYTPSGIKKIIVNSEGGRFLLGSGDATLEVPPGAVRHETLIYYAIILHGPFVFPAEYKLASVVIYLNLDGATLFHPVLLHISDWCVTDGTDMEILQNKLIFVRATHEMQEDHKYFFSPVKNEDTLNSGTLQIKKPQCLYAKVHKEGLDGLKEWYQVTPFLKEEEDCFRFRILFTWFSQSWCEVHNAPDDLAVYGQHD